MADTGGRIGPMTTDVLDATPPALGTDQAADIAGTRFGIEPASVTAFPSERDQNFRLTDADGGDWVLKVSNAAEDRGVVEMEVAAVERIAALDPGLPVPVARRAVDGSPIATAEVDGTSHLVRLIPLLPGRNVAPTELDAAALVRIGEIVARVGLALRGFFHPAAGRTIWWDQQRLPMLFRHAAL